MDYRRGEMNIKIEVNRMEFLRIMENNREAHSKSYKEDRKNWHTAMDLEFEKWQHALNAQLTGLSPDGFRGAYEADRKLLNPPESLIKIQKSEPLSHMDEYDEVIEMFAMDVRESFMLDRSSFQMYVKDNWEWKEDEQINKTRLLNYVNSNA